MNTTNTQEQPRGMDLLIEDLKTFCLRINTPQTIETKQTKSQKVQDIEALLPLFGCNEEAVAKLVSVLLGEEVKVQKRKSFPKVGEVYSYEEKQYLFTGRDSYPLYVSSEKKIKTCTLHSGWKQVTPQEAEVFINSFLWKEAIIGNFIGELLAQI